jgi:hypothetical protein
MYQQFLFVCLSSSSAEACILALLWETMYKWEELKGGVNGE